MRIFIQQQEYCGHLGEKECVLKKSFGWAGDEMKVHNKEFGAAVVCSSKPFSTFPSPRLDPEIL